MNQAFGGEHKSNMNNLCFTYHCFNYTAIIFTLSSIIIGEIMLLLLTDYKILSHLLIRIISVSLKSQTE